MKLHSLSENEILILVAMREETQSLFAQAGVEVFYTGLGKVNATYALMKALAHRRARGLNPKLVLNFGSAGSSRFAAQTLVQCTGFIQRDMDVSALGFAKGVTPFAEGPWLLESKWALELDLPIGICGSGDSFETQRQSGNAAAGPAYDVVDMEAFALAKVCQLEDLNFCAVKYITDGADESAKNDWAENLPRAAQGFFNVYRELTAGLKKA